MVTDGLSENAEGGGESRSSSILRYGDKFDEMCGEYLAMGMSYHDYWDGDNTMTKFYRRKSEIDKREKNYFLWLQGAYIYEALLDTSPVVNALSSRKKPYPYMVEPVPLTEKERNEAEQRSNEKKLQDGKEAMRAIMVEFNKRFEENKNSEEGGS